MRFSRRSLRSLPDQPLPSIQTLFYARLNGITGIRSPLRKTSGWIEDGIELVPIERQNSSTTKICTPGTEEKEVVPESKLDLELAAKPLPSLPGTRWSQLSTKNRILAILCVQFLTLLTIGLSLMAAKEKKVDKTNPSPVQSDGPAAPPRIQAGLPIQRGTFALAIGAPQQRNSACLARNNESAAWTCSPQKTLQINVLPSPGENMNLTLMSIEPFPRFNTSLYGLQDPNIEPLDLTPAIDAENTSNGPAYYFRTSYSRTVLLRQDQIADHGETLGPLYDGDLVVQPGDRPWLCVFNDTLMEGYIYVSQNSTSINDTMPTFRLGNNTEPVGLPFLPYVMKITEQRVSNSTRPSCVSMRMQENGNLTMNGAAKMLKLSEAGFAPHMLGDKNVTRIHDEKRQQTASSKTCQCQWMIQ